MKKIVCTFVLASAFAVVGCESEIDSPTEPAVDRSAEPGTRPADLSPAGRSLTPASLSVVASEFGQVSLSQDAIGTNTPPGILEIVKPVGATVRSARLFAASTGFSGFMIPDGVITLNGTGVSWDQTIPNAISSFNHRAVVTSHVKALIDAAPAGVVVIPYDETSSTTSIEGAILAVIFDDPGAGSSNTVNLLFGAQEIAGDTFTLNFADPISTAGLVMDMSLGISFGFQPGGQVSLVDINGQRLTSCAGGQDDGQGANGALMTVGGTGDLNDNPDPNCTSTTASGGSRVDDELYNIVPFLNDGDTQATVFTSNPSADDNIYYASFFSNVGTGVDAPPPGGDGVVGSACPVTAAANTITPRRFGPITFWLGTDGPDIAVGGPGVDIFVMKGGDDLACGLGGRDAFNGGSGDDTWFGGTGNDVAFGMEGSDTLHGEGGLDHNDGGHTGPTDQVDLDTDTCTEENDQNFLCEVITGLAVSSARYKQDVRPLLPGHASVLGLRPVAFRFVEPHGDPAVSRVGLLAEEVLQLHPAAVVLDVEGGAHAIDYGVLRGFVIQDVLTRAGHAAREAIAGFAESL